MGTFQEAVQEGIGCKQIIYALGGVVTVLGGLLVTAVKFGWAHVVEDLKIARDRVATLEVAQTSALRKKGESP